MEPRRARSVTSAPSHEEGAINDRHGSKPGLVGRPDERDAALSHGCAWPHSYENLPSATGGLISAGAGI
jgi:hypothetical protein